MKQRKQLYGLLILLAVMITGLLLVAWQLGSPQTGSGSTSSPPRLSQSAAEAAAVLRTWLTEHGSADDAIVACTLTLSPRTLAESGWTFQVYSAQKNRLLVARVHAEEVQILRDIVSRYPPVVLSAAAWKRDSEDILTTWWREGGASAWNATATPTLVLRLAMREDRIPAWQLTLEKDNTRAMDYWEIRADTGMLLEHSSGGR